MNIDRYAYLLLGLFFLSLWLIAYALRKDLRSMMLRVSVAGAVCGPISEIWFFRDYWLPPTIFGKGILSVEDVLFGFAVFGVSFAALAIITGKRLLKSHAPFRKIFPLFVISFFVGFFLFSDLLGINSIIAVSITMLLWSAALSILRRNLFLPSLLNGLLLTAFAIGIYLILLGVATEYLSRHWLLWEQPLGKTLFGVPLTEVLWYFCLGCSTFAVTCFSEGKRLE